MTNTQKWALFLVRIALGWLFLYAGVTKLLDPDWSAAGYIAGAKTLPDIYAWLLRPDILPIVNLLNIWGQTLIGAGLILGVFTNIAARFGALLMVLYYIPLLTFPFVGHGYIVDEHIIFALALILISTIRTHHIMSLGAWIAELPPFRDSGVMHDLLR